MIYYNNAQLRDWLLTAEIHSSRGATAGDQFFEFNDREFEAAVSEVLASHRGMNQSQAEIRAAYRLLTRPVGHTKVPRVRRIWWEILRVIWAVLVLLGIWAIAAKADPGSAISADAVVASAIRRGVMLLPSTGGIVLQLQNQGTALATRGGGLVVLNCSTNMSCSFSGSTFTMTATATASTAWSSLTAGINSNVGTFSVSGNTWDFTSATQFKLPSATVIPGTAHGVVISEGTGNYTTTGAGTAGQVLISQGAGADPIFADPVVTPKTACGTTVFNLPLQQVPTVNTTATAVTTCLEVVTLNNQNSSAVTVNLTDNQGTPVANLTSFQIMPNSLIIQPLYGIQFLSGIRWVASTTGVTGAMFGWQ